MKKGKKESYDLIVNINLDEWKLSPEQVDSQYQNFLTVCNARLLS